LRIDQAIAPDQEGDEDLLGAAADHVAGAQHELHRV